MSKNIIIKAQGGIHRDSYFRGWDEKNTPAFTFKRELAERFNSQEEAEKNIERLEAIEPMLDYEMIVCRNSKPKEE